MGIRKRINVRKVTKGIEKIRKTITEILKDLDDLDPEDRDHLEDAEQECEAILQQLRLSDPLDPSLWPRAIVFLVRLIEIIHR